jgi:hypothetical protein
MMKSLQGDLALSLRRISVLGLTLEPGVLLSHVLVRENEDLSELNLSRSAVVSWPHSGIWEAKVSRLCTSNLAGKLASGIRNDRGVFQFLRLYLESKLRIHPYPQLTLLIISGDTFLVECRCVK